MRDDMFYDEIIRPMQESMIACIWRVTQSHEDAQDALQEALWTIWRKRRKVAKHPKPKALILKICRAKAIDSLRKSIRRAEHELPCVSSTETPCDPRVSASPDEELHSKDVVARVRRVVSLLPRKRAQAVFMRLVEEQPYADIALSLGCSEATVRSHVRRGRTHLQKALRHINGLDVE
jgi:RNA polymerase sigma-70 factor (ECF subfamily)